MIHWEMGCGVRVGFSWHVMKPVAGDIEVVILGTVKLRVWAVHCTVLIGNVRMDLKGCCRSLC